MEGQASLLHIIKDLGSHTQSPSIETQPVVYSGVNWPFLNHSMGIGA